MATTSKKKGKKGFRKQPDESPTDPLVVKQLEIPQIVVDPKVETSLVKESPVVKEPPKLVVRAIQDQKAKTVVQGKVSINFTYGGQSVRLLKGKKTHIPIVSLEHCRRLNLI